VLVGREEGEVVLLGREGKREFSEGREAEHVPAGRECGRELAPRMELAEGGEQATVTELSVGRVLAAGRELAARRVLAAGRGQESTLN
jgi:hypothetical protein